MHRFLLTAALSLLAGCAADGTGKAGGTAGSGGAGDTADGSDRAVAQRDDRAPAMAGSEAKTADPRGPLDFTMNDIDGKPVDLSHYRGRVVLIVNTASLCGHTPQYKQLEALYEQYEPQGLSILAFPANDFRSQEPGTDAEIKEFCTSHYNVKFDLFSKVVVHGDGICPLYTFLTSTTTDPQHGGEIKWNFTKFLVDRHGALVARFEPAVVPDDPAVVKAIEQALAEKTEQTAAGM